MTDERKAFLVQRILQFHDGQVVTLPVGFFDNEDACKSFAELRQKAIQHLMQNGYLCEPQQGPQGLELVNTGMKLGQLMNDLGLKGIGHSFKGFEVRGADIVTPPTGRIIVPH